MDWVDQLILTYYPMMQTMFQGHQSCGSCKEGLKGIHCLKIVCEHDQEIPQSQTADTTPWHCKEETHNHQETLGRQINTSVDHRGYSMG